MSSLPASSFATLLRRYRTHARLTQEELAERAGLSAQAVSTLERGTRRAPRRDTVALLARALALSPEKQAALEQAAGLRATPAHSTPRSEDEAPTAAAHPLPPLAGRVEELAQLARHLTGEGPPLLLLAGEPGIGKTRLLYEAANTATRAGWTVLRGGCQRRSGQEPFAPFTAALARHLSHLGTNEQRAALRGCAWLVRLLPELAEAALAPAPAWPLAPDQERRLMFAAVTRCLANVAGPAGTLVLLDDLQWAGPDALDLLAFLIQGERTVPLRIVAAYRDTEVRSGDALDLLAADLARDDLAERVTLGLLSTEEARSLLDQLLAGRSERVSDAVRERLVERTGGLPFFLVSCAQTLRDDALASEAASTESNAPWYVAESIRHRVSALPEQARELLGAAAVVGRNTPVWLLAQVTEVAERSVLDGLDTASHAHVLIEQEDGSYQFAHDLVREVVAADLSTVRRRALHRRIAEALEQAPGGAPIELLAYHYARSGETEQALIYLERAGDRAQERHAHADAEGYYRELIARLEQLGRTLEMARAREQLANVLTSRGLFDEAVATLDRVAAAYQSLGDEEGEARAATHCARVHALRGDPIRAIARLQHELDETRPLSDRARALVYAALMYPLGNTGRYAEELAVAEQAAAYALAAQTSPFGAEIRRGHALTMLGRLREAKQVLEDVLSHIEGASGALDTLCSALNQLSQTCTALGDNAGSLAYTRRVVEVAQRMGNPVTILLSYSNWGWSAYLTGEWGLARSTFQHAVMLAHDVSASWAAPYALLNVGVLYLVQGQQHLAEEYLGEGATLARATQDLQLLRWLQQELAEVELLSGQAEAAYARLEPLLDRSGQESIDALAMLPYFAWSCLELQDESRAKAILDHCLDLSAAASLLPTQVATLNVQAMLAGRQGRWVTAQAALEQALALTRTMPYPYGEAKLLYAYGQLEIARGQPEGGCERFEAALAICRRMGERLYAEYIERALAGLKGSMGGHLHGPVRNGTRRKESGEDSAQ